MIHNPEVGIPVPAPSCWRLRDGDYLLCREAGQWPRFLPEGFTLPNGEHLPRPLHFIVTNEHGAVIKDYLLFRTYSLEDTLYLMDVRAVLDGNLLQLTWEQTACDEPRVTTQRAEFTSLHPCEPPLNIAWPRARAIYR